jgi:hypothetical protein
MRHRSCDERRAQSFAPEEGDGVRGSLFVVVSVTVPIARHLALMAFGLTIALAAWPPANGFSWGAGGRSILAGVSDGRMVTEVTEGAAGAEKSAVRRFLPAGIVLDHPERGAAYFRLSVPSSVSVGLIGVLWLALLVAAGPPALSRDEWLPRDRVGGGDIRGRSQRASAVFAGELARRVGYVWTLRWAAGAACVAGAWFCVYTLPMGAAGMPYSDAQALHVAGAALGVFMSTVLIAFD